MCHVLLESILEAINCVEIKTLTWIMQSKAMFESRTMLFVVMLQNIQNIDCCNDCTNANITCIPKNRTVTLYKSIVTSYANDIHEATK